MQRDFVQMLSALSAEGAEHVVVEEQDLADVARLEEQGGGTPEDGGGRDAG